MPITREIKQWLSSNGFTNYCFISYAHTGETEMTAFAKRIQNAVESELKYQVPTPGVFLAAEHTPPGNIWTDHLKNNLSSSVAMIAIISQIYFSEEHAWCGREWAAMSQLGSARFPGSSVQPIIPVLFRNTNFPPIVGLRQFVDLSRNQLLGRRYFSTTEFRSAIQTIVKQIEAISQLIYANRCRAVADNFDWPDSSPFIDCSTPPPPPLRSTSSFVSQQVNNRNNL
jgi:hypothetical protein